MTLRTEEVHVWAVGLVQADAVVEGLRATLSEDERERAEKFYFEKHQREYVVARGALRNILARYMRCEAGSLEFNYSLQGKPMLVRPPSPLPALEFNLSHSGQVAIYVVTRGRRVGIDIEAMRKLDDLEGLARSNFSAAENAVLKSLPASQKHEAFFNCWTRKEAYIKALGDGLGYPLDQFDVTLRLGEKARLLKVASDPQEAARWRLEALDVAIGYTAAVIVEGQDWTMRMWRWDGGVDL